MGTVSLLVDWVDVYLGGGFARRRGGPADGVAYHALHAGVVVRGVGLVAGAEVEDPAASPPVAAAASGNLSSAEPAHEAEEGDDRGFVLEALKGGVDVRAGRP